MAPQRDYLIGVGDVLDIKFTYNPELNELNVPVRPDGKISLQLAPDIQAVGLTSNQFRTALVEKYAPEINKPVIGVFVVDFRETNFCGWVSLFRVVEIKAGNAHAALALARGWRESPA